jgi:S1-C subfamily serine protease
MPSPVNHPQAPLENNWRRTVLRIKKNPAVWLPIAIVVFLVSGGLITNGGKNSSSHPGATTVAPNENSQKITPADGTINDLIVHSIVSIVVYENGEPCAIGSGSVVGDSNHVLTNNHVIASDKECTVDEIRVQTVANSSDVPTDSFIGKVEAQDETIDLAILSLTPMKKSVPVLRPLHLSVANSVGQNLIVVGFPVVGGDSVTVSQGIISGFVTEEGVQWLKTDAALSGGNSGGAALDSNNNLIGIPTMYSQTADGSVTDCRHSADTNDDGIVDGNDTCVGIGGTFTLMATSETAIRFARSIGLDLSLSNSASTSVKP